jgi:hypothetical protein
VFPACVSPADDGLNKSPNRIEDQSIFQDYQAVNYVTVHIASQSQKFRADRAKGSSCCENVSNTRQAEIFARNTGKDGLMLKYWIPHDGLRCRLGWLP